MANNEKLEDLLNLALETPEKIRQRSQFLETGYDRESRSWELIVKYRGSLDGLRERGIYAEELLAGYAILNVPEDLVETVGKDPHIEYAEKPKRYYTQAFLPQEAAEAVSLTRGRLGLSGQGVLVAVIDSGVSFERRDFRTQTGESRILYYWDQAMENGVFSKEELDAYLRGESERRPLPDPTGHGTAVAGIAAGYSGADDYEGMAVSASLLVVKLGSGTDRGFARTTDLMRGVAFALQKAEELQMPVVINLSYGSTYGPHDGSMILERFLDQAAQAGRCLICVGSGNEGASDGHYQGKAAQGEELRIAFGIAPYESDLSLQIWKDSMDLLTVELEHPGGERLVIDPRLFGQGGNVKWGNTRILCYYGTPLPYRVSQEIYLELLGENGFLESGQWHLVINGQKIRVGNVDVYLEAQAGRNRGTGFLEPSPDLTLTIPSAAGRVLTVGAYDPETNGYADFSGRGGKADGELSGILERSLTKPDLAAPGVRILAPDRERGYGAFTGTSFAAPILSGSSALWMEWGIVRGNDPYLYGEKLKAVLRECTEPLSDTVRIPDNRSGYGGFTLRNVRNIE